MTSNWAPDAGNFGTATAVIGTATTLVTGDTLDGTYVPFVNLVNMAIGDITTITVQVQVLSTGTLQTVFKETYGPSPPIEAIVEVPAIASAYLISMSILQAAGTPRSYDWALLRG